MIFSCNQYTFLRVLPAIVPFLTEMGKNRKQLKINIQLKKSGVCRINKDNKPGI